MNEPNARPLARIADHLQSLRPGETLRVAVDGVDGVGKTTFADLLSTALLERGRPTIRASVDSFHNPREERYRRGKASPEGFYLDSYNYPALQSLLLVPLGPGGSGRYRTAAFDHLTDAPVQAEEQVAEVGTILIVDGLFLHRPELRAIWDFSIFLAAPFEVTIPRGATRGPGFGSPDPSAPSNRRYVGGQRIYLLQNDPHTLATVVIDNSQDHAPRIVTWRG